MKQCAPFVLVMAALGGACACSASGDEATEQQAAESSGENAKPAQEEAASDEQPHMAASASQSSDSASSGAQEVETQENADATANAPAAACVPTSDVDLPDDDFVDANCDGIDGERSAAIFVSPAGFDEDLGTLDAPVHSLNHAVELAAETGRAVYVCNGTYRENLEITAPVAIYGGYDCSRAWQRIKDWAVVESGVGVQLSVRNVNGLVHIERMAFRALDATAPGQSSQAALIVGSAQVELVRVELATGNGAAGSDGRPGSAGSSATGAGANGADASSALCSARSLTGICSSYALGGYRTQAEQRCFGGTFQATRGGRGGRGGNTYLSLAGLVCPTPVQDLGFSGDVGEYLDGNVWLPVSENELGRPGTDGFDGAGATRGIGELEAGVYVASNNGANGGDATHGLPAGGGRGGLATGGGYECYPGFAPGSGGGQGGAGGCAGSAATGGIGGGGAIGLAIVNSHVSLNSSRFTIGNGGRGGNGALGGAGQPGTPAGSSGEAYDEAHRGGAGYPGGVGGNGGDGGPGGGGPSIAILYSGAAPQVTGAVYDIGSPGDGGTSVSLRNAPPGVTGEIVSLEAAR